LPLPADFDVAIEQRAVLHHHSRYVAIFYYSGSDMSHFPHAIPHSCRELFPLSVAFLPSALNPSGDIAVPE